MKFNIVYLVYCGLVAVAVTFADSRGWILTALSRGGVGRSYSAINHK